jgi:hypothetical protein
MIAPAIWILNYGHNTQEVIILQKSDLLQKLLLRESKLTLRHVLENSKADSGGERDVNFLAYLVDSGLLLHNEAILKRTAIGLGEEYYLERYKQMHYESDRHFLCRTMVQDELKRLGIDTFHGTGVGDMSILRSNSSYDIAAADFSVLIDIGLTPARNYFRGLTDTRVKNFLLTTYFDDYMDDIIFFNLFRSNDEDFLNAVRDFEEGFKMYAPNPQERQENRMYYNDPSRE